ncbi:uncharacterized protein [Palaemon carinicauda]|uniref:uncharacterized protein n=1 Tax=Palaemon carinicauda TaxID=392227 RepID=UPI0035B66A1B
MGGHIFGAVSSPGITNYALRAAADHAGDKYGPDVERTIKTNFYVDDYLNLDPKPLTRRGILSTVSSLYDLHGSVAPFLLPAKRILREVCQDSSLGWDDVIPEKYLKPWRRWLHDLPILGNLKIQRFVKPKAYGTVTSTELHMFSDASNEGYGAAAYIRLSDNSGRISTALLMGKSRVCPVKATTIPRLELTAAVVSINLTQHI